jgi:hypothetical protein
MARYTDPLDPLLDREAELRRAIARRIAEEAVHPPAPAVSQDQLAAAEDAIAAWAAEGEEEQDLRAFRPLGPLQELLAEHAQIVEQIAEMRERRLG